MAPQDQKASTYTPSTFSESTTYSYTKPADSQQATSDSQTKKSWRQRVKNSFKVNEIGHTPAQDGKRPEYGVHGQSPFTDNRGSRMG